MSKRSVSSILALLVSVGFVVVVWFNRYNITDYIILRGYNPPVAVNNIAKEDTFNDYGKRLFFVKRPEITDRSSFGSHCKQTEQTIVLGCYNGVNIYLFKVEDPKLDGVEQVTAAHEMLHVAYERLGAEEKKRVDSLIDAAYKKNNDPRITALADSYQKQEPGSVPNELHSILGTEVNDLGPELEAYYSRYFNDRSKVVQFANNYQKVFENINGQVKAYDADLALRKSEIDRREADLNSLAKQLQNQKIELNSLVSSGQVKQYNDQVNSFNVAINDYNAETKAVQQLVAEYNQLVNERNKLNIQQQDLAKNIDSRLDTIDSQ